jgi:hypothetical protein
VVEHCQTCGGDGRLKITSCPKSLIDSDVVSICHLVDHYDEGHRPVSGGVYDQTRAFCRALRLLKSEDSHWAVRRAAKT